MNVAHSIDYVNTEIYIASGNFMCTEKNNQEYSFDKIHPVDPDTYCSSFLPDPTLDSINSGSSKDLLPGQLQNS